MIPIHPDTEYTLENLEFLLGIPAKVLNERFRGQKLTPYAGPRFYGEDILKCPSRIFDPKPMKGDKDYKTFHADLNYTLKEITLRLNVKPYKVIKALKGIHKYPKYRPDKDLDTGRKSPLTTIKGKHINQILPLTPPIPRPAPQIALNLDKIGIILGYLIEYNELNGNLF